MRRPASVWSKPGKPEASSLAPPSWTPYPGYYAQQESAPLGNIQIQAIISVTFDLEKRPRRQQIIRLAHQPPECNSEKCTLNSELGGSQFRLPQHRPGIRAGACAAYRAKYP